MIAGVAEVEHGIGRGEARGEGERVLAALERGEASLQGVAGRVAGARVFEALVLSRPLLRVRRGEVDRRHHSAGGRVGVLPRVDGERLEAVFRHGAES